MSINSRITILFIFFSLCFSAVVMRLFYWQVLASQKSQDLAWGQYNSLVEIFPFRGEILSSDGLALAGSQKAYLLYASLPELDLSKKEVARKLSPIILPSFKEGLISSESASLKDDELLEELEDNLEDKLSMSNLVWVSLQHKITPDQKKAIEKLDIKGLGFEEEQTRYYPEASMAAHLLGFVGKDEGGQDKGYFGLEGYYDLELKGRPGLISEEKDASNNPILFGSFMNQEKKDGNTLVLSIDRAVQFIVEKKLNKALETYGAKSGNVTIMDPYTGEIIAMAAEPKYDPKYYFKEDRDIYKNPIAADTFEPGSIFKIFVMAAAIDQKAVKPDTKCDICDGSYKIGQYSIKTWDEQYYPDSTMTEVIQHSDNVGMVFTANKLGLDKFLDYLSDFGFGQASGIDLQEEAVVYLKEKKDWKPVDMATAAFGQGISVTGIQILKAAGAIANGGMLIEPHLVKEIITEDRKIKIEPKTEKQVIKPETSQVIKEMMVNAVDKGESKWIKLKGYRIAGKTGTAQIPIAGHYDKEKTIASFIGFAPADKPKLVMLITLREPESSPWASETAAPLFFNILNELLVYYGIQPD
jgi:cell division protein FtsI (penicillin-binding protein 3)